jgi:hypothetical protein
MQMCVGWQWQQNAGDDGGDSACGDGDSDDGCHAPMDHGKGVLLCT